MRNIFSADVNMKLIHSDSDKYQWFNCEDSSHFYAAGSDAFNEGNYYRLTKNECELLQPINDGMVYCSTHSAGIQIRFTSDARFMQVKVELRAAHDMPHMPATGQCGVDLYVFEEKLNEYVLHNTARFDIKLTEYTSDIAQFEKQKMRKFILNLPLYQGVKSINLGISGGSVLTPMPFENKDRIFVYGSSIVQGGCVSRPGILSTNILSRKLNCEVINFGFSGVAFAEKETAEVIGARNNQSLLIIDCEPNAGIDERMEKNLPLFIETYRLYQPKVPIVLVSRILFAMDLYDSRRIKMREYYKKFLIDLTKKYYKTYFLDGSKIFKHNFTEYTVDGIHPTDAGNMLIADAYLKIINKILGEL
jgi:hypothetical protein